MGLAASQARLLLLTARKSDLEYRAQMICQRKTMLAMQSEEVATNYSKALNNRKLYYSYTTIANANTTKDELLTYSNFTAAGNTTRYRLIDAITGEIVALNATDAEKYKNILAGSTTTDVATGAAETTNLENPNFSYKWANVLKNPEAFQNAIQSGSLIIQKLTQAPEDVTDDAGTITHRKVVNTWESVAVGGMDDVASKYYTEDDGPAEAEYTSRSLMIQTQDKQLDTELKQVETQQKACESEIDSVKKILDKNIEKSFKTFA